MLEREREGGEREGGRERGKRGREREGEEGEREGERERGEREGEEGEGEREGEGGTERERDARNGDVIKQTHGNVCGVVCSRPPYGCHITIRNVNLEWRDRNFQLHS